MSNYAILLFYSLKSYRLEDLPVIIIPLKRPLPAYSYDPAGCRLPAGIKIEHTFHHLVDKNSLVRLRLSCSESFNLSQLGISLIYFQLLPLPLLIV